VFSPHDTLTTKRGRKHFFFKKPGGKIGRKTIETMLCAMEMRSLLISTPCECRGDMKAEGRKRKENSKERKSTIFNRNAASAGCSLTTTFA